MCAGRHQKHSNFRSRLRVLLIFSLQTSQTSATLRIHVSNSFAWESIDCQRNPTSWSRLDGRSGNRHSCIVFSETRQRSSFRRRLGISEGDSIDTYQRSSVSAVVKLIKIDLGLRNNPLITRSDKERVNERGCQWFCCNNFSGYHQWR